MQRRIQSLPVQLANQIAAGEVVERPSSVVKELLENSIDAGADQIELEVEQGGTRLIRVRDNGSGIVHDDLALAVSPHATSKIYTQQELEQIASLGFRGEALASIASVSRFKIASRVEGEEQGWELGCDGPRVGEPVPSAIPYGTQVEVRELFYNIPARRKFLRSERTEFLHLEEVVKRLALSRFDVAFTLIHNGRQVLRLRPAHDEAQQGRRVSEVLGRGFIQQALKLDFDAAGMRLSGWLSLPDASRSQADSQYFYLNGRMIRDKLINHAIRQAHQSVLEPGRYPAYALFLWIDPGQVDVNVHPTKHEVRFRESRLVHDFVFRTLLNALTEEAAATAELPLTSTGDIEQRAMEPPRPWQQQAWQSRPVPAARVAEQNAFYRQTGNTVDTLPQNDLSGAVQLRARAILHRHYLLAERGGEPLLLDLAAVRSQLLAEHLHKSVQNGDVRSQPLLIPQTVTLNPDAVERLLAEADSLNALGFELERLGEESVVLRRIPALLRGVDISELLPLLHRTLSQQAPEGALEALQSVLVEHVVDAIPVTDLGEADRLLIQLEGLPDSGEGLLRPLSLQQLQHWFERSPE